MRGGAVVARQAHNLKAVGSIPAPATNILLINLFSVARCFAHCSRQSIAAPSLLRDNERYKITINNQSRETIRFILLVKR